MTTPNSPPGPDPQRPAIHPVVVDPALVPERRGAVAMLSSVLRDGEWMLPRLFRAAVFMGEAKLDLTRARIGPGESHIEVKVIFGNVVVLMPPDLRVEYDVDPVVGSFDVKRQVESTTSPDAPLVRISGSAFMGAVTVKIVDPNSPSRLAKLRARLRGGK